LGPNEAASLKALGEKTKAVAIEPNHFNQITSATPEDEDMARERPLIKHCLDLCTETLKSTPHIRHAGSDPDLRSGAKLDHLRRLSRIEHNSTRSAPVSTLISARPGNSMWIEPEAGGCPCPEVCRFAVSHAAATVTGSKAVEAELGSDNSPRSKARRHLNTWFAFTPCARATNATLAPGSNVSSTIHRFSATDRHRRTRRSVPSG
jgi:hypothetical protein